MMPYLKEIRKSLKCHVAALPINFRTTKEHPTFFNLPDNNGCSSHTPHKTPHPNRGPAGTSSGASHSMCEAGAANLARETD